MANSNFFCRSNSVSNLGSINFTQSIDPPAAPAGGGRSIQFQTATNPRSRSVTFESARCSIKGCVFPAVSPQNLQCAYHRREQEEPSKFRSRQPSHLLLDPARCMPQEEEYDRSRERDRRRLAALREQFQTEDAV